MSISGKALAIKRINKDMKEITKNPVEGIGIASLNNDPMKYVVNICLMSGIYKGYCVQLLLTFSDNYPTKPPKILIYPDQTISGEYHHHIFQDYSQDENGHYFKKFCFDLLDNDFMSISEEHTGWNPSYSISSLLLQVQNFIADPDMPSYHLPNKNKIDQLMRSMDNYRRTFTIKEGDKTIKKIHTWKNPYPEMYFKKNENNGNEKNENNANDNKNDEKRMELIKENLTCFMLKLNYIDDPDILLGYPIVKSKGLGKDKIELYPIPELLTYDGYIAQTGKQSEKLDFYFDTRFKSANNEYYNCWVPIYIDRHHYEKNKTAILNSFSIIKFGDRGIKEYDFKPKQIFEILPIILNKMIIGMFNGKSAISSAFIISYFHYVLLFKKLCLEFENDYLYFLNHKISLIEKNEYIPNKTIIPDIGDFFMLLFFSNQDMHKENMKKIWYHLFEEFLVRQMFWIFHNGGEIVKILDKIILPESQKEIYELRKELCVNRFKSDSISGGNFIQTLKDSKIFEEVLEILISDDNILNKKNLDNNLIKIIIINKMIDNLKKVFNDCSDETREKLYKIFCSNETFYKSFILQGRAESEFERKFVEVTKVKELLKNKEYDKECNQFINDTFNSYRGNKLLLITFFAQKKIEEKGFMEQLEKDYGIYLDVDNFIKGMKEKLKEIKSYHEFFEYIGSEFGTNKNDKELINEAYEKAIERGYLSNLVFQPFNLGGSYSGRGFGRGRGRGRGTMRGSGGRGIGRGRGRARGRGLI